MYLVAQRRQIRIQGFHEIRRFGALVKFANLADLSLGKEEKHNDALQGKGHMGGLDGSDNLTALDGLIHQLGHKLMDLVESVFDVVFEHGLGTQQLPINQVHVVGVLHLHFGNGIHIAAQSA